jgi:transposase
MAKYKQTENYGGVFMTVDLTSQIELDPFAHALKEIIDAMDLTAFDENYHNDDAGAAAFPPSVLLKIIMYCYSKGILSSRKMEDACKNIIIVKALADEMEPDHSTIASFVSSNPKAINRVAVEVVLKCAQLGLIKGDMFAIDGCKLPSNASKEWSGTLSEFKKKRIKLEKLLAKIIEQQKQNDKADALKNLIKPVRP